MSLFQRKDTLSRRIQIDDRGESRIKRLAQVATSKSVNQKVLELAWTAGPVTLIASIGGYYFGHGKMLPKESLLFFIAYTIIAGVIGLVAHLINSLGRGRTQEQVEEDLSEVMGALPDHILDLRDLRLQSLDKAGREWEAARILLEDVELGPRWISTAVTHLGGGPRLAEAAECIDIYRRAGMPSRAKDIYRQHLAELTGFVTTVRERSPALAVILEQRFLGRGEPARNGIPRGQYFLERIFAAVEDKDDNLMTLEDVEDLYALLFELLCGRHIPMLSFSYAGRSVLAQRTEALEERRLRFHLVNAKVYSRLLAMATFIADREDSATLLPRAGLKGSELIEFCDEHIQSLIDRLENGELRGRRHVKTLEEALSLYRQAFMAHHKAVREYKEFQEVVTQWKKRFGSGEDQRVQFDDIKGRARGLQVVEDVIRLSDKSKLKVVSALAGKMKPLGEVRGGYEVKVRHAKQTAIEIALLLDEVIEIRRPEVQRAIYNSKTINMGIFEKGMSIKKKVGWGEALAKEIQKDMRSACRALVSAIYTFYGLKLDEESREQLTERYGVTEEELDAVYRGLKGGVTRHDRLPKPPLEVPRPALAWRLALGRIKARWG